MKRWKGQNKIRRPKRHVEDRDRRHSLGELRSCIGKVRLSEAKAEKAARKMEEKHERPFTHYYCGMCGKWHVGTAR